MILTEPQKRALHVLAVIANEKGGYISNVTSAEHGGLVASPTAHALQQLGLVEVDDPKRGGTFRIRLTDAGREAAS